MNRSLVNLCIKSIKPQNSTSTKLYLEDIYLNTLKKKGSLVLPSMYSNRYSNVEVNDATNAAYKKYNSSMEFFRRTLLNINKK